MRVPSCNTATQTELGDIVVPPTQTAERWAPTHTTEREEPIASTSTPEQEATGGSENEVTLPTFDILDILSDSQPTQSDLITLENFHEFF